jgi:hypothetical protein
MIPTDWRFENSDGASFGDLDPHRASTCPEAAIDRSDNTPLIDLPHFQTVSVNGGPEASLDPLTFNESSIDVNFLNHSGMYFVSNPGEEGLFLSEDVRLPHYILPVSLVQYRYLQWPSLSREHLEH